MKICPQCGKEYADDMNFCLEDGSSLYADSEKTIPFGLNVPRSTNSVGEHTGNNRSDQPTEVFPAKKSRFGIIITAIIAVFLLIVGIIGYGLFSAFSAISRTTAETSPTPAPSYTPLARPTVPTVGTPKLTTDKVKIEVLGKVKGGSRGGYEESFIKCLITNQSDGVLVKPSVKLTLYRNDFKIGDVSGEAELEYVKPGQSIPVWVKLWNKDENYTAARPVENTEYQISAKDTNRLFPNLIYNDAKMTAEEGSVMINFRSFKETYYAVKGTVENRDYDVVNAEIFMIYYDANSEIIGISSTSPPELKRGEKAAFEGSMSRGSLFGVPARFELIAIDDTKEN